MKHVRLGASGLGTSIYGLGTATFGDSTDEDEMVRVLDTFVDAGGLLIDTADAYTDGRAEQLIGRWLRTQPAQVRERVLLSTKGGGYTTTAGLNQWGNTRHNLTRALETSLRSLGVDCITLYQAHTWDPLTPLEETLRFLDDAVRAGKIRYAGISNYTGWQVQKTVDLAGTLGLAAPITFQAQYSLLCREIEWEIVPAGLANGLGLLAWSPLSGGLLTGKYLQDETPVGPARFADTTERGKMHDAYVGALYSRHVVREGTWQVLKLLGEMAAARNVSPAAVALAWLAGRPGVSGIILGVRNAKQLADNLEARWITLDDDEIARLTDASDPCGAGYPYGHFGAMQRTRTIE
ncbi:aldo/keto reductase [Nocardia sp. NEAU-G5]|uniref:Aldo/keto reductase n=1 Tax=Nocardia albiluteola TaxID=2842303 RepID=A0ABS6BCT8_9NOCA|nr:aldo/keto reductase [Nocardia albiluteola]MBU3068107.1 aldo/keto reductase [Nocardia albiluteola]